MLDVSAELEAFKAAFQSKEAFIKAIQTKTDRENAAKERNPWKNEDLDLSPPKDRTWSWYSYVSFWVGYGLNPGTWSTGSALIAVGLTTWQAAICMFIGYAFGGIGIVLHSRSASVYHFGFPVEARVTWGFRGAYFPVLLRCLTALIWTGVAIMTGGYHTAVVLRVIFGDSFWKMNNTIPTASGITLPDFVGLVVYWFLTCLLLNVSVPKLRIWVQSQAILMPFAIFGLFIWCMVTGKNSPERPLYTGERTRGATLGWLMISNINSVMGKTSTLVINQPDIARYAKNPRAPLGQLIALPIANTVGAVLGIYGTASLYNKWGNMNWNPWLLEHDVLDHLWGPGARAGIFFTSAFFIFSAAVTNMGANVVPFGADITTFFPRWLNIRRGMWMAYILSVCICPWYILSNAFGFLTFLGGYGIFLGPFLGIFVTDYFVVRRGNIYINDLFDQNGKYWYKAGFNWRAIVAWIVPVVFVFPGFLTSFGIQSAGEPGWGHLYSFSWFFVCTISSVVYYGACWMGNSTKAERAMPFESLAVQQKDIIDGVEQITEATEIKVSIEAKV